MQIFWISFLQITSCINTPSQRPNICFVSIKISIEKSLLDLFPPLRRSIYISLRFIPLLFICFIIKDLYISDDIIKRIVEIYSEGLDVPMAYLVLFEVFKSLSTLPKHLPNFYFMIILMLLLP